MTILNPLVANASDSRNKGSLNEVLGPATRQMSLFSKGKLILMDEVDGMQPAGITELIKLSKKAKCPIVCLCNFESNIIGLIPHYFIPFLCSL